MNITCPNCKKGYELDEKRLSPRGAIGKCRACGHRFKIEPVRSAPVEEMSCPKCGHDQPEGAECARCGIVFDKLNGDFRSGSGFGGGATPPPPPQGGGRSFGPTPTGGHGFSVGEAVSFGWKTAKAHLGFLVLVLIVGTLISAGPEAMDKLTDTQNPFLSLIFALAGLVMQTAITLGYTKVSLNLYDTDDASLSDLFSCFHLFFHYLGASILYFLMIFVLVLPIGVAFPFYLGSEASTLATVLLTVTLLVVSVLASLVIIKFMFFGYCIVDREIGPIKALKMSSAITRGNLLRLSLLGLVLFAINVIGLLLLVIGLLVTIPLSMMAVTYAYRTLEAGAEGAKASGSFGREPGRFQANIA